MTFTSFSSDGSGIQLAAWFIYLHQTDDGRLGSKMDFFPPSASFSWLKKSSFFRGFKDRTMVVGQVANYVENYKG